jgi:restriction system protein
MGSKLSSSPSAGACTLRDTQRHGRNPEKPLAKATSTPVVAESLHTNQATHERQVHRRACVFASIEWRRFEAVCEALFAQVGFETQAQSHGADGGGDIWLHSRKAEGPVAVVQCKHWKGNPVGVKELREFLGVMASHRLKRGTYATTSTYTADAQAFAKANGINALDGAGLLALIGTRTTKQQSALLDIAFEGDHWCPTCATCGIKLLKRKPAKGGAPFWGCANYPRCKTRIYMGTKA